MPGQRCGRGGGRSEEGRRMLVVRARGGGLRCCSARTELDRHHPWVVGNQADEGSGNAGGDRGGDGDVADGHACTGLGARRAWVERRGLGGGRPSNRSGPNMASTPTPVLQNRGWASFKSKRPQHGKHTQARLTRGEAHGVAREDEGVEEEDVGCRGLKGRQTVGGRAGGRAPPTRRGRVCARPTPSLSHQRP